MDTPNSYQEAVNGPMKTEWIKAIEEEKNSLLKNNTWITVDNLPKGKNLVDCKWIFKIKNNPDGSVARYKARLVAKDYSQEYGIDYNETFSPVVKYTTLRTLFSIAAARGMKTKQMDVKTAFLHGDLDEEIYMKMPEGFGNQSKICKLVKGLYGLKQSPRQWNKKLNDYLLDVGFRRSTADPCLYVKKKNSWLLYLGIYVDDLMIFGDTESIIEETAEALKKKFEMTDLGTISYCLGLEVKTHGNGSIKISQRKYLEDILQRFNMNDCKPVATPLDPNCHLTKEINEITSDDEEKMKNIPYKEAIGSLMYLMIGTRPDIAAAVCKLSQFMQNPGLNHWSAIKRVFRYLQGTKDYELVYKPNKNISVVGYSDADWANDLDDRKSISGYIFKVNGNTVSWSCKKQKVVALSSTEAEYMAYSEAVKEAIWIRELLKDLNYEQLEPSVIFEDNQSTIKLAKNPVQHSRTKHIDTRHHFIRQMIEENQIAIEYCPTEEMIADLATKGLTKSKFNYLRDKLGIVTNISSRGGVELC
jgi:hypothetical protein